MSNSLKEKVVLQNIKSSDNSENEFKKSLDELKELYLAQFGYQMVHRKKDNKWAVIRAGATRATKVFKTREEAEAFFSVVSKKYRERNRIKTQKMRIMIRRLLSTPKGRALLDSCESNNDIKESYQYLCRLYKIDPDDYPTRNTFDKKRTK